jgi:hypothetical protein
MCGCNRSRASRGVSVPVFRALLRCPQGGMLGSQSAGADLGKAPDPGRGLARWQRLRQVSGGTVRSASEGGA